MEWNTYSLVDIVRIARMVFRKKTKPETLAMGNRNRHLSTSHDGAIFDCIVCNFATLPAVQITIEQEGMGGKELPEVWLVWARQDKMIPFVVIVCWWLIFGLLLSWWAGRKNRNRLLWGLVGPLFFPASLIFLVFSNVLCPDCHSPLGKGEPVCIRCERKKFEV